MHIENNGHRQNVGKKKKSFHFFSLPQPINEYEVRFSTNDHPWTLYDWQISPFFVGKISFVLEANLPHMVRHTWYMVGNLEKNNWNLGSNLSGNKTKLTIITSLIKEFKKHLYKNLYINMITCYDKVQIQYFLQSQ